MLLYKKNRRRKLLQKKSGGMGKAILWLVVLAAVGGFAFVWISRGSLKKG